jgi:hypothetical protein
MAPPKSPWNKLVPNSQVPHHGSPTPQRTSATEDKSQEPLPAAAVNESLEQAQQDELEVLKAIYMDDFEEVETKGAWSVSIRPLTLLSRTQLPRSEVAEYGARYKSLEARARWD